MRKFVARCFRVAAIVFCGKRTLARGRRGTCADSLDLAYGMG
jgi:hypothetical protein